MNITLKVNKMDDITTIRLYKDLASSRSHKEFACSVNCNGQEYHAKILATDIQDILQAVLSLKITPFAKCGIGIDGITYELLIEEDFATCNYQWWMEPGDGWSSLARISEMMLNLGFRVSGQYMT